MENDLLTPEYIFYDGQKLIRNKNINKLLFEVNLKNKLKISNYSLSFLLQNGIVPLPFTIYENLYISGFGYTHCLNEENKKINFKFNFPFKIGGNSSFNKEYYLNILTDSIEKKLFKEKSFLLHSAGKDSNIIALCLSRLKDKHDITLINQNYSGKLQNSENEISKRISKKLGLKHITINDNKIFNESEIKNFFQKMPLPCLDNLSLAYIKFDYQIQNESNIIDGMGNDIYLGHISSYREFFRQLLTPKLSFLKKKYSTRTLSRINLLFKTRSENTGMIGFSYLDSLKMNPNIIDTYNFWKDIDKKFPFNDYNLFRSLVRGIHIDNEMYIRKSRNFCDIYNHNLVLPFYDTKCIEYLSNIKKKYLYNSITRQNKIIFRQVLKDELDLDYNIIKKKSFEYDYSKFLNENKDYIINEIEICKIFSPNNIHIQLYEKFTDRKYSETAKYLLLRLFLIASWVNNNKYL